MSLLSNPPTLSDTHILNLFNLSHDRVDAIDIHHDAGTLVATIQLIRQEECCPTCNFPTTSIKGYTNKTIIHSISTQVPCLIQYRARRYLCPACRKTFYEKNPFSHKNMKLSAATVYAILNELKQPTETFSTVATRYHVSPTTAAYIFDAHVMVARRKLPLCICIDEVYAFSSSDSDYVCVLVDFISKKTIDLLPSRKKVELNKYFSWIPLEERKEVEMISCDMWETYRDMTHRWFPNAKVCVDRFHVMQETLRRVDSIRKETMNRIKPSKNKAIRDMDIQEHDAYERAAKNYYLLKKFHWLLFKNEAHMTKKDETTGKIVSLMDPNYPKQYNRRMQRYLNLYDIYNLLLEIEPKLSIAMRFKARLDEFYENCTYETAEKELTEIIDECIHSDMNILIDLSKTLRRWKKEIINSFLLVKGTKKRPSNGIIENRNKIIKQLKNNANGFKNWSRFRNRALYVLNDDVNFSLNPTTENKKGRI